MRVQELEKVGETIEEHKRAAEEHDQPLRDPTRGKVEGAPRFVGPKSRSRH